MVSGKYEKKDKVLLTFINLHQQMCVLFARILRLFQQLVTLWIQHLKVTLVLILLPSQVLLKELLDKSVERMLDSIFIGIWAEKVQQQQQSGVKWSPTLLYQYFNEPNLCFFII